MGTRSRCPLLVVALTVALASCGADDAETGTNSSAPPGDAVATTVVLELAPGATAENVEAALEAVQDRLDALGVAAGVVVAIGVDRIEVGLPSGVDGDLVAQVLSVPGDLSLRPTLEMVPFTTDVPLGGGDRGSEVWLTDEAGAFAYRLGPSRLGVSDVATATAVFMSGGVGGQWVVNLEFTPAGADEFAALTAQLAAFPIGDPRRMLGIVIDGVLVSAPVIAPDVDPEVGITGGQAIIAIGEESTASALAAAISSSILSIPIDRISIVSE